MKQHELLQLISKFFSRFSEQVNILNKNGEFSINIHAENVLINILNIIFDTDFENMNYVEGKNYDSIDLRDKKGNISIQVTATSSITKIKDTLETYIKNGHYKNYKELKILILTGRQEKYSQDAIDKVVKPDYTFDCGKNIIDFATLYRLLNKQNDLAKILAVKELLESQFSDVAAISKTIVVKNFKELCEAILPYLKKNEFIFLKLGPNSGADSTEPLRWDLTLWYKARREKLLPNNNVISNLIIENESFIPAESKDVFNRFLTHAYAFEKHCEDSNFDYSQYLFPKEITKTVNNGCNQP